MSYIRFFLFILIIISPLIFRIVKTKHKKRFFSLLIVFVLIIVGVTAKTYHMMFWINENTQKLFNSDEISSSVDDIDYMKFVIPTRKHVKNVLLIGTDKGLNKEADEDYDTDIMVLISIDEDTNNIYMFSLPMDTLVKRNAISSDICNLNEISSQDGIESLLNCIRLNYGINIDEYIMASWQSFISFIDIFFEDGISIELTEMEMLGINQIIPSQNKSLFTSKYSKDKITSKKLYEGMILDPNDENEFFGIKELEYIKKKGYNQSLYDINNLPDEVKGFNRKFDDKEKILFTLNGSQLLAYCRLSLVYSTQNYRRDSNNLRVIEDLFPKVFVNLSKEKIMAFTNQCVKQNSLSTSYDSFQSIVSDFLIPLKSIHVGKVIEFDSFSSRVTSIPMTDVSNYGEDITINYTYQSLHNQSRIVIYE